MLKCFLKIWYWKLHVGTPREWVLEPALAEALHVLWREGLSIKERDHN